jgi:hypothetical protein
MCTTGVLVQNSTHILKLILRLLLLFVKSIFTKFDQAYLKNTNIAIIKSVFLF